MKKQLLLAIMLIVMGAISAQNVKYVNSPVPLKEKGVVSTSIIGGIDDVVYVLSTKGYASSGVKITAYAKETSKLVKSVSVRGFDKKVADQKIESAYFSQIIVKNNELYVVWEKSTKAEATLILQIFDKDLIEIQKPRILYRIANKSNSVRRADLFFFMSANGSKMIVGGQESSAKNENVKVQYKVMGKDQEVINTVQTELPYSLKRTTYGTGASFEMDDNGYLYFSTSVDLNNETKKSKKEVGCIIGSINPETSEVKTKTFSFQNKMISNFSFEIFNDHLFVVGTFSTKFNKKNKNAELNNGVFTCKIDKLSFEEKGEVIFNELDETKVAFTDYTMSSNKKKKYTKEEFAINKMVDYGFLVTDYKKTEDNGIIMTINTQQYRTVCNNKGSCSHYTDLFGVNYIKVNAQGEIDWISCTEQKITYSGFVVPKNKLAKKEDKYLTVVRSKRSINSSYLIDDKTGMVGKSSLKNKFSVEESDVVDDELYFVGMNLKMSKTGYIFLGTGAALIPISIFTLGMPGMFIGIGVGLTSALISAFLKRHDVYFGRYELQ